MMKRSFAEIDSAKSENKNVVYLNELEKKFESESEMISCPKCVDGIYEYYCKCSQIKELQSSIQVSIKTCTNVISLLSCRECFSPLLEC